MESNDDSDCWKPLLDDDGSGDGGVEVTSSIGVEVPPVPEAAWAFLRL